MGTTIKKPDKNKNPDDDNDNNNNNNCPVCLKRFTSKRILKIHVTKSHEPIKNLVKGSTSSLPVKYRSQCGKGFPSSAKPSPGDSMDTATYYQVPCGKRKFICIVCARYFPTREALQGHWKHHRITGNYLHLSGSCNSESTVNNTDDAIQKDVMKVDEEKHYNDDECLQEESCGSSQPKYEEEIEGGVGDDDECQEKLNTSSSTTKKDDSSVRRFCCGVCGKEFPTHQRLGGHMGCHREKSTTDHDHHLHNKEAAAAAPGMKDDLEDKTSRVMANLLPENDSDEIVSNRKGIDFDLNEMPRNDED